MNAAVSKTVVVVRRPEVQILHSPFSFANGAMILKTAIAIVVFTSSLGICPVSASDTDPSDCMRQGIKLFVNGNFDQAIFEFNKSIRANSDDYYAHYHRAKAFENKDDFINAIADYSEVIRINPPYRLIDYSRYYRGVLYQKKKLFDKALADYNAIIEDKEASAALRAQALNNRGLVYDRQGKFEEAISDYNKAIKLVPSLFNVYYNRGASNANLGAYISAIADFNKELDVNPHSFPARHYNQALAYYFERKYQKSWYEVFRLMRSGERVSSVFIADVKKSIRGKK